MLTGLLITILMCFLVGAALTIVGLRGRRTDAHPICRRCGFDLHGRFPWSQPTCPTCPDCGELLIACHSVRPGAKALRTRFLACGCMLCFPGLMILLAGTVDALAGGSTAALKPTSLIATQVSGSTAGSATLGALISRVAVGSTTQADIQPAIERALTLQADRSLILAPQWLDLLETARRRGMLSPQQTDRYFQSAFDWRMLARPPTERGPVTFALQGLADRLAPPPAPLFVTVSFIDGSLDGKPLGLTGTGSTFTTPPINAPLVPLQLLELVDTAQHSAGPERALTLATQWQVEVHAGTATGPIVTLWTINADAAVDVLALGAERTLDKKQTLPLLTDQLAIRSVTLERDDAGVCWASFTLKSAPLICDVVATLRITTPDGRSFDSTTPVTITPSDPRWPMLTAADPNRSPWKTRVPLSGLPAGPTAVVELIPLAGVARSTTLASPVWSGEPLNFENVVLTRPNPAAAETR